MTIFSKDYLSVKISSLLLLIVLTFLSSCNKDDDGGNANPNIVQVASSNSNFTTLVAAIQKAGLASTLQGTGPFTVFAPTNAAFTAAGIDVNAMTADQLRPVLLYHVLSGRNISSNLTSGPQATQNTGNNLYISVNGSDVYVNGNSMVSQADIEASNGIIHAVNSVLIPPSENIVEIAAGNPNFSLLVQAVTKAGLVSTLSGAGPFTVFAPTNAAFEAAGYNAAAIESATVEALTEILTYHVIAGRVFSSDLTSGAVATVEGSNVTINVSGAGATVRGASNAAPSNVTTANILGTNGVIHVIDRVLLP